MKVYQVSHSDIIGGAARAAYRIHHALRANGVESTFMADLAVAGDWTVHSHSKKIDKAIAKLRPLLGSFPVRLLRSNNQIIHSPSILPSLRVRALNESDADLVHLHWVQGEMLSVADIGRIKKPVVWTLHDMWAFCGAEHYTEEFRWRDGYLGNNRSDSESGFDLNRWTWERKSKNWHSPIHIVTPSRWLAKCVQESALMSGWPVNVVPNCLDLEIWQPLQKNLARQLFGLPTDVPLLLFGAMGGGNDKRKGFDLLLKALDHLRGQLPGLQLVVFGQLKPKTTDDVGFPIHYMGHLHDDLSLRALYSAADALVIPSRQDNLPNTGVESLACGTPVVAFNVCGMPDIVEHQKTGYLVKPFDTEDLAHGIQWILKDIDNQRKLGKLSRSYAENHFSNKTIASKYKIIYEKVIKNYY